MSKRQMMLVIVAFLLFAVGCSQPAEVELAEGSQQSQQVALAATATPIPPTPVPDPTPVAEKEAAAAVRVAVAAQQAVAKQSSAEADNEMEEVASERTIRITVASANLRSGPGLTYETIGIVLFNDAFKAIAEDSLALWYKVELADGQQGWVAASVTEEISDEVYETLVDQPESSEPAPDVAEESETTAVAEEPTEEVAEVETVTELPEPPVAIEIDARKTGIYTEPTLSSSALAFVVRGEVFLVNDMTDDGKWVLVSVEDGVSGWVRMTRAGALDEAALASIAGDDVAAGQVGSLVAIDNANDADSDETAPVSVASSSGTSTTSIASTSSSVVPGSFGRTRIRPGSVLYFDTDNTGYGVREAVAPSGPSGIIGSYNVPTKAQVADGWTEEERYSQELPRIMMLGDQFTAGTTPIANGYRRHLYNLLTARNFAFDFVGTHTRYTSPMDFDSDHEGHVYYRADQILAGAWGWTSYDAPDYVLMLVGMNDVLQGQSAESTGQDIQLILNTLRYLNPNVKIVLSHLPYTADAAINKEIDLVNMQINRLSYMNNTGNSPIYIISQWDIDPATDTYDGIHLNAVGAEKMAQHFYYGLDHFWLVQTKTTGE